MKVERPGRRRRFSICNFQSSVFNLQWFLFVFVFLFLTLAAAPATRPASRPGGEITPPPRRDVPGQRVNLTVGQLFVPDFFKLDERSGTIDLFIWFLGNPGTAQAVFHDARKNAVLLVASGPTLKAGFVDGARFDALLDEVTRAIRRRVDRPIGRITLVSFSGGYTAVRDILHHPRLAERISDVVLLDSLYAPRIGQDKDQLDPAAMEPFVSFAKRAAEGKATFLFTQLYPPEPQHRGNTTTLAATYLIDAVGADRTPPAGAVTNSRGAKLLYRADKNNFHVLGYAGMTNQDHFEHFYSAADVLKQTSAAAAE